MRRVLLIGGLAACAAPDEGDGYVLGAGTADVDGASREVGTPIAVPPGTWIRTAGDRFELGGGEVAVIDGDVILVYGLGAEVASDALAVDGPDLAVRELADTLGLELDRGTLFDPDVWAAVADHPADPRLTFRPVAEEDLPGTVPAGGRAATGPAAASPLLSGVAGLWRAATDGGRGGRDSAQDRARSLFSLPEGGPAPLVRAAPAAERGARLVGRYCGSGERVTLGADGVARWCLGGRCDEIAWSASEDGDTVFVGDRALTVDPDRGGFVVGGLVDGTLGGCR